MLIGPDQYVTVYQSIKEEFYSSQERKALVFVATDSCDSVCATKTLQVGFILPRTSTCCVTFTRQVYNVSRYLQSILHRDSVPFALYPVTRYSEVQELCNAIFTGAEVTQLPIYAIAAHAFSSLHSQCNSYAFQCHSNSMANSTKRTVLDLQELQTLILINCGATEDLSEFLGLSTNIKIIVIDSHRPIHHNLNGEDNHLLVFCNPADGTCDDVPEPDIFSGAVPDQIGVTN